DWPDLNCRVSWLGKSMRWRGVPPAPERHPTAQHTGLRSRMARAGSNAASGLRRQDFGALHVSLGMPSRDSCFVSDVGWRLLFIKNVKRPVRWLKRPLT